MTQQSHVGPPIRVPPRERPQDVGELVTYFLAEFCARNNFRRREMDPDVIAVLERHHWPGNVRELRNVVERMAILTASDRITAESIPLEIRQSPSPRSGNGLQDVRDGAERDRIRQALDQAGWNVAGAARLLGTERTSLHKRHPHTRYPAELEAHCLPALDDVRLACREA